MAIDVTELIARLSSDPGRDMDSHLLVLYSLARFLPTLVAVEIGVDDGSSTLPLLMGTRAAGGHLHSVDIEPCRDVQLLMLASGCADAWTFHQMRSADFLQECKQDSLDLVLIDGDHSLSGISTDWRLASRRVRLGGMILFHDTLNTDQFPGIGQVIERQVKTQPDRFECCTLPYGWGLTLVRRIA